MDGLFDRRSSRERPQPRGGVAAEHGSRRKHQQETVQPHRIVRLSLDVHSAADARDRPAPDQVRTEPLGQKCACRERPGSESLGKFGRSSHGTTVRAFGRLSRPAAPACGRRHRSPRCGQSIQPPSGSRQQTLLQRCRPTWARSQLICGRATGRRGTVDDEREPRPPRGSTLQQTAVFAHDYLRLLHSRSRPSSAPSAGPDIPTRSEVRQHS